MCKYFYNQDVFYFLESPSQYLVVEPVADMVWGVNNADDIKRRTGHCSITLLYFASIHQHAHARAHAHVHAHVHVHVHVHVMW